MYSAWHLQSLSPTPPACQSLLSFRMFSPEMDHLVGKTEIVWKVVKPQ